MLKIIRYTEVKLRKGFYSLSNGPVNDQLVKQNNQATIRQVRMLLETIMKTRKSFDVVSLSVGTNLLASCLYKFILTISLYLKVNY